MTSDLRPVMSTAIESLETVAPGLRARAAATEVPAERDAFLEAAVYAEQLTRRLRNLIHFAGVAGARSRVSSAPGGSRPPARHALPDETGLHGRGT